MALFLPKLIFTNSGMEMRVIPFAVNANDTLAKVLLLLWLLQSRGVGALILKTGMIYVEHWLFLSIM